MAHDPINARAGLPVFEGLDLTGLGYRWSRWPGWSPATLVRRLDDDRFVAVYPLLFTHRVIVGRLDDTWGYTDGWCYVHAADALTAATAWDGTGEPAGWHRHPDTGRRRPDGDPDREYVNP